MHPTFSFPNSFRAALLLGAVLLAGASAAARVTTIAIVKDGSSPFIDDLEKAVRREAQTLTSGRATLKFKEERAFNAGWRDGAASTALDAALGDAEVDYVLVLGARTASAAGDQKRNLNKPVLGAVFQEPDLVPLPINADGRSQKENFAVVALASRTVDQFSELRSIVPATSIHILVDDYFATDRPSLEAWQAELARSLQVSVTLVPTSARADETLAAVGPEAKAIYLFPTVRMDASNRAALLQGLSARKFPVLSYLGQAEVEAGALAGVQPDSSAAVARRVAINLDQLIAGAKVAELPLRVSPPRQLYFNEHTASEIGFAVDFAALNQAVAVRRTHKVGNGPELTLSDAILTALEKNYDFRARQFSTEAARQSRRAAVGTLFPQASINHTFQQIDRDRAAASGGSQPQSNYRATLGVSQVLLDDEMFTRARIAREAQRAASHLEQAQRLDTVYDTGRAYLNLLSAQASLRVTEENFEVTQRNLELARLRQRVGTSGPEEAYRFESAAAQQRADLAAARAQADQARLALNRVLGVDASTQWTPRDATLADPAFACTTERIVPLVRDQVKLERFRSFTAIYAATHSPDLAALEQNVKAQRLSSDEKSRRRHAPKISASFNYSRLLRQDFVGAAPAMHNAIDRNDWTLGVTASVPLFAGGALSAEARKARAEYRELQMSYDGARASVIAQTQASLYALESSFANIRLSRAAADLAAQNLAVVQEKYERGAVSIVTLLDAQNAAFAQRQSADVAVYRFLSELLQFQRLMGWVEALATSEEKEAWFAEVERAVSL